MSGVEEGHDREDAAVGGPVVDQAEFGEHRRMCAITVRSDRNRVAAREALEWPSATRPSTSTSRGVRASSAGTGGADQRADDLGVDRAPAIGHAPQRVVELREVQDPVLEQVAEPGCADQVEAFPQLDVLRQQQDAHLGTVSADPRGRAGSVGLQLAAASGCPRSPRPAAGRHGASIESASPTAATTSCPASASSRTRPSRNSIESSPTTTRIRAPPPPSCRHLAARRS